MRGHVQLFECSPRLEQCHTRRARRRTLRTHTAVQILCNPWVDILLAFIHMSAAWKETATEGGEVLGRTVGKRVVVDGRRSAELTEALYNTLHEQNTIEDIGFITTRLFGGKARLAQASYAVDGEDDKRVGAV